MTGSFNRPRGLRRFFSLLPGVVLAIAVAGASAFPQQAGPPRAAPFKVRTELVSVDVSVADARGRFLANLDKSNFRVFDNAIEQPITFFAPVDAPARVLVLVETSPAVYLIHRQHLEAAYALLAGLAPDDRIAVATYDQTARLALPLTADKQSLAQTLLGLQYNLGMGELNFYDAVSGALDWLHPLPGKKALVLLTTGLDSSPASHWDALVAKVRASDVAIFSLALGGSLRRYGERNSGAASPSAAPAVPSGRPGLSFARADEVLRALAQMTGGRVWFPIGPSDFAAMYRQMAEALRHEYTLGFEPKVHDARYHSLVVQVLDAKGRILAPAGRKSKYRVYAREGYLAPSNPPTAR